MEPSSAPSSSGTARNDLDDTGEKSHKRSLSSSTEQHVLEEHASDVVKIGDAKEESEEEKALARLPESERTILKKQIDVPPVKVSYFTMFRYATHWDIFFITISAICAIGSGALMPMMTIIFGSLTGTFQHYFYGTLSHDEFNHELVHYSLYFIYLGIGMYVVTYIETVGFIYTGEHMTQKIRENYMRAILRQNIAFFDKLGAGEITTRITSDMNLVQEAISEKVGLTLVALATFITAYVIGFIKNWTLALILTCAVVAIATSMSIGSFFIVKYNRKNLDSYALGGTVAEEVISSIRNATAFNTQDKLAKQYDTHLQRAEGYGIKLKVALGMLLAVMFTLVYLNYSLAFWEGSRLLVKGNTSMSAVLTTLLAIMIGAFSLGNVAPNLQHFTTGVGAAAKIFSTIDRNSPINPHSGDGEILDHVEGNLELRHVKHIYPSRVEVTVMNDVSLIIPAGKTTALVGASGSGKSTIVGMVERFYDPVGGEILLDGHNIQSLNLQWLRRQISLVSQEPTLFGTTIYENIWHGLIGTEYENIDKEKQRELIENAAKLANAHDFISGLPDGYDTDVGERGFLMSGGQKQRIAIARAMVSDPKILLLDEATSALDTKSEGVVQAALDKAAKGRTTIVIAHRLSTIKTADNIVVMSQGSIVEQGSHDELLARKGAYYHLVLAQRIDDDEEDDDAEAKVNEVEAGLDRAISQDLAEIDPDDVNLQEKLNRTGTNVSKKSLSSVALGKRRAEGEKEYSLFSLIKLITSFNKKETTFMIFGLLFSIVCGGGNPVQSVFFAKAIVALSLPKSQYDQLRHDTNFWSLMYLMLAIVELVAFSVQGILFGICSERMVHRVRDRAFRTMLRQDIAYFDKKENTAGALTSFLSTETTYLSGMSGVTLGTLLLVTTTLVSSIVLGLAIAWKLTVVCLGCVPVLLVCGFLRFWILAHFQQRAKKVYEQSATYACEATSAIRTVASLTREEDVLLHYHEALEEQARKSLISVLKSSFLYASSQALIMFCLALGFWYGGRLIGNKEYGMLQFFIGFNGVIFGAQSAGTVFSFAPDMGKAQQAAQALKTLFDRKPEIDSWSAEGDRVTDVEGTIEFRDVHFRYPTRPEQPVLRGLNITIKPGQYVALVGASGCGKSTTIALLERFYNPLAGGIFVDGKDISRLHLNDYRSFLSLVSQEPTLYQGTIRDNVLLGVDNESVPEELVVQACKDANIYDFIMSLPDGFNTVVGSKGAMLSGGQKQRIAIARALIRDPRVLLLDEATSALDSESEKVVQAALDAAAQGRTTIAVAHRLSTIQNADIIYVFEQGRIVESGTHHELMKKGGRYSELVNLQSLGKVN